MADNTILSQPMRDALRVLRRRRNPLSAGAVAGYSGNPGVTMNTLRALHRRGLVRYLDYCQGWVAVRSPGRTEGEGDHA